MSVSAGMPEGAHGSSKYSTVPRRRARIEKIISKLRVLKHFVRPNRANRIHFLGYLLKVAKQAELNRKVKVIGQRFGQCDLGG